MVPRAMFPDVQIDVALERMIKCGVRPLLVTDAVDVIVDLVTVNTLSEIVHEIE